MREGSFGAALRALRERRAVTLATISEQTKIKESLLEALERDDLSHWPTGLFKRAYVRAYAVAAGLDADDIVQKFLAIYPDPVEPTPPPAPSSRLQNLFGRLIGASEHDSAPAGSTPPAPPALPASPAPAFPDVTGIEAQIVVMAGLCTRLSRAGDRTEIGDVLRDAVKALNAVGMILWISVARSRTMVSVVAEGYPEQILAQLPAVPADADNAIGAAVRSARTQIVAGTSSSTGAIVAPLVTSDGCAGVLAIELQHGAERCESTRGFATILAAQLAAVIPAPVETAQAPASASVG